MQQLCRFAASRLHARLGLPNRCNSRARFGLFAGGFPFCLPHCLRGFVQKRPLFRALPRPCGQLFMGCRQINLGRCGTGLNIRNALGVAGLAAACALQLNGRLARDPALFPGMGVEHVPTLAAFGFLGMQALDGAGLLIHLRGQGRNLHRERGVLLFHGREFAPQHDAQTHQHVVAQQLVALRLGGLALQRGHLPHDFVEDVVDAGQVLPGLLQAQLSKPFFGFKPGNPCGFLDNGPAVVGF